MKGIVYGKYSFYCIVTKDHKCISGEQGDFKLTAAWPCECRYKNKYRFVIQKDRFGTSYITFQKY